MKMHVYYNYLGFINVSLFRFVMEEGILTSGIEKKLLMKMITSNSRLVVLFLFFYFIYVLILYA